MSTKVSLAYVGNVVPETAEFVNGASSRAGTIFQLEMIKSMMEAGLRPEMVVTLEPVEAFPRTNRIWSRQRRVPLGGGVDAILVSFVNITPLKQLCIGLGSMWHLCRWRWATRNAGHHVILCYNLTVPPGFMVYLAARLIGAKLVAALYDINVPGQTVPNSLFNRLDYWMHLFLIPRLNGYVVVTDEIMNVFAPGRDYLRVEGAINGEIIRFKDSAKGERGRTTEPLRLVVAGRLSDANGIREILQAAAKIRDPRVQIVIAGTGPLTEEVKQASENNPRIKYAGFLSYQEVLKLYASADVLINMRLTQKMDSRFLFPSKLMEYLASGVPVITTSPGKVREEFGGLCYVLKDESPEGLAALIDTVACLDVDERREMGRRARAYMLEHKTWSAQGARIARYIQASVLSPDQAGDLPATRTV